jgi:predicted small lipoprotein YifL
MKRTLVLLLAATPLAACGLREPLRPPPGETMPPAAAMARRAPTTEELLTPPPIARPERVDELLRRSEERTDDRFDLPPPDVPAGDVPATGEDEEPE